MIKSFFATMLAVMSMCTTPSAWADDTTQILDKVAATYGSQMPVALRISGSTISFSRGEGAMLRLFKSPDRFRSEITYASGAEVRTMVGPMAWNQSKPANPALRSAVVLQAARIALPWNVLEQRKQVVDMGRSEVDGKAVQTLEFTLEPTLKMLLQIESDSGRIIESRGIMVVGQRSMEFTTKYSDFRSVDGHTYAAHEEQYAMGQHIGHTRIQNIEFLDTLPDSAFAPWTMVQTSPDLAGRVTLALR